MSRRFCVWPARRAASSAAAKPQQPIETEGKGAAVPVIQDLGTLPDVLGGLLQGDDTCCGSS
jgi:hypothetical protein